ncbi:hypothetical protein HYC85_031858 [Camellia sinensis]|uniref:Cyclic nucleotide-binding domain-containing protein n=1 Tax=Camellia sinensis TaxID=4442 RepID=A0A7J7FRR9_CAMSI|nr:hypothetical protein HYC85_031858 [Camellia sinensis]
MFYIIQIYVRFCTAYVAPSSRVFGRGELVIDYSKIVSRYLRKRFWIDVIAALPLPQVLIWLVIPNLRGSTMANTKGVLRFIIIFQYLPRLFLIFTLSSQIVQATGIVTKRAWQGAAYNLMLYMLASHTYLQSTTARLEEWRIKRTDTEQWMHHRQLPPELRQAVRKYDQYKWVATRGVDEEALLKDLPLDLWRDIKRHLCLDLVRRVSHKIIPSSPSFPIHDPILRLKPGLSTQGMCLVREGDPVDEMLFIIRGNLDSNTTNGGRTGFFSSCSIGPGDFCGEELLTWALDPHLKDLKFVASQFRRLHSKKLRHKFRFYSHQWRLWAACFVQVVWRHYRRRKIAAERKAKEHLMPDESELLGGPLKLDVALCGSSLAVMAARLAATTRRGVKNLSGFDSSVVSSLKKPEEPDFSCG